ncbi:rhomboid family intramembrane serine protease [Treponema sp. OMZ 840]|uniref:rhomboid family intramembrane serine protease n=1 Tax=Treponema sp. OMZ 840 TaxID=244313 RepID=UPI003D920071
MTKKIRIVYTSPLSGCFVLACTIILVFSRFTGDALISAFFSTPARQGSPSAFNPAAPFDYIRLFIHIFGHKDALSFGANAALILLLGPQLEERYGAAVLSLMMGAAAFVSGVCNAVFAAAPLYGSDGIVFLLIILYVFAYAKKEGILFTNILLFALYLFGKLFPLFGTSAASNGSPAATLGGNTALIAALAHLLGGLGGSLFAFAASPAPSSRRAGTAAKK